MKVMKFGGTSVGSAEQIKKVAKLINDGERNIVVLSAMSGTTNTLVEICDYLYKENVVSAKETINMLQQKYVQTIYDLYSSQDTIDDVDNQIDAVFGLLRYLADYDFTSVDEREILAQGEIMSTILMNAYLKETGVESVLLPTLEYVRTDEDGDPDIDFIEENLNRLIAEAG
ncbi:MAG: aspartate kinase, partial [Muribaculaceae bacterium]|nr:aspartate kinase [Muribaculaceae bacterium]